MKSSVSQVEHLQTRLPSIMSTRRIGLGGGGGRGDEGEEGEEEGGGGGEREDAFFKAARSLTFSFENINMN